MDFSLDTRSNTIKADDKYAVYHVDGTDKFYYKKRGNIVYLTDSEVTGLCKAGKWFIEHQDSDFGDELNDYFLNCGVNACSKVTASTDSTVEPVIFRKEYDPYSKIWGYLAIFPEDEANRGRVGAVPFHKGYNDKWTFEPYTEIDISYMLRKKIVHKNDPVVPELLAAIESMYGGKYRVVEKLKY